MKMKTVSVIVIAMTMTRTAGRRSLVAGLALAALALTACSTSSSAGPDTSPAGPADSASAGCPVTPIPIAVSVDQWTDIVSQLAGDCGTVQTILQGSAGDPHDYEPTPGDAARINGAQLVVLNGAGYDTWATKLADSLTPTPAVVDGGKVVGVAEGGNPHLWYSPAYVDQIAAAVTAELTKLAPTASAYFAQAATDWQAAMKPYHDEIATVKAAATGKTYGATEGVFDYMAEALGLTNKTPQGWQNAAANESDPAPGDISAFQSALTDKKMDLLVYNIQTEGSAPESVRATAEQAGVPVVEVTETMPDGVTSFVDWQVGQLQQISTALGS